MPNLRKQKSTKPHKTSRKSKKSSHKRGPGKNSISMGRKPHHSITIRTFVTMDVNESSASEFAAYHYIKPYNLLNNSAWSPLQKIYEKMRVRRYNVKMYLPRQAITDKGRVVAFLERDSTAPSGSVPFWPYSRLLEMPGRKERNNLIGKSGFSWTPIDPEDYDYSEVSSAFDNDTFGLALYSGWVGSAITTKPVIEVSLTLDFIDLLTAPDFKAHVSPYTLFQTSPNLLSFAPSQVEEEIAEFIRSKFHDLQIGSQTPLGNCTILIPESLTPPVAKNTGCSSYVDIEDDDVLEEDVPISNSYDEADSLCDDIMHTDELLAAENHYFSLLAERKNRIAMQSKTAKSIIDIKL